MFNPLSADLTSINLFCYYLYTSEYFVVFHILKEYKNLSPILVRGKLVLNSLSKIIEQQSSCDSQ